MSVPVLLIGNFLSHANGSRGVCEELADRLLGIGWPVLMASDKSNRAARLCDMISTVIRRRRGYEVAHVDVFSGNAFLWSEATCAALRLTGKPYVLTLHGGGLPEFAQRHPMRVRRLLQSARAVTTPSRYLMEAMAAYRPDMCLVPNAMDLDRCQFRERSRPEPSLIWLRAFHQIYNPTMAVEVVKRLQPEFPGVHLRMIGPDKGDGTLARVRETAERLGVGDRIEITGKVPKGEVPEWLNRGDIFLNTTNVDNAPVSVLEAMGCGLCVVSTDVGGLPYLVEDQTDALLVAPYDAASMARAVRRVLTEPALAARLSRNARSKARQHDWSVVLARWQELFSRVARRPGVAADSTAARPPHHEMA